MAMQTGMSALALVLARVSAHGKTAKAIWRYALFPSIAIGSRRCRSARRRTAKCSSSATLAAPSSIVAALNLTAKDLFPQVTGGEGGLIPYPMQRLQRLQRSSTAAP